MKPPAFDYHAPAGVDEAVEILAEAGAEAKILAGGQSLIPLLNMRLVTPGHIVDVNRVAGLGFVEAGPDGVRVGALARHSQVERLPELRRVQPLLGQALRLVAHPVIRNRGTVVGSIAHADPAAELPAVLALLGGSVQTRHAAGGRTIPAAEFFVGPLESALEPGELAVSVFFPALPPRSGTAFAETARRHGDYAIAGVAALVTLGPDGEPERAAVACVGVGPVPIVVETPYRAGWDGAAEAVAAAIEPEDDIHATAAYRRHLTGVLAVRALGQATEEARG
ncbi:FAD binding domain-containing protein [Rhizohabitans arisaemae]|uniref:FAD binding domain-containing protein n=1 Tax=Rhizohabitans arisaemae TaxID=2720610 RepID=UPI0024B10EFF|nr:FAD binding domain-containing protein [Rhizohabitans arisaemae]